MSHNLQNLKPFKKGQSGNPKGRPKGARSRLSENFIAKLADDFEQHGQTAIETLRVERPEAYIAAVGRLVSREDKLEHSGDVAINRIERVFIDAPPRLDDASI